MHNLSVSSDVQTLSWISNGALLKARKIKKKNFNKCHFNFLHHSIEYDCMFLMSNGKFGYLCTCLCCECSILVFKWRVKLGHLKTIDDTVYPSKALRSMYGMFWPDTLVTQSLHYSVTKEAINSCTLVWPWFSQRNKVTVTSESCIGSC